MFYRRVADCRQIVGRLEITMEIIPINDSKLKIMLDERDMKELNICDEADCANNETRHAIRTILDRARLQLGFNTEGAEIFVQLYTSKSGGCELFVTKSCMPRQREIEADRKDEKKQKKRDPQQKRINTDDCHALSVRTESLPKSRKYENGQMVFSFDSLHDVCAVCRILQAKNAEVTAVAYRGEADDFYLVLDNTNLSAYSRLDSLSFILEYGRREHTDYINTYLCEHGKMICPKNAIEILSKL